MKKIFIVGDSHFAHLQPHLMSELMEKVRTLMGDVEVVFLSQDEVVGEIVPKLHLSTIVPVFSKELTKQQKLTPPHAQRGKPSWLSVPKLQSRLTSMKQKSRR